MWLHIWNSHNYFFSGTRLFWGIYIIYRNCNFFLITVTVLQIFYYIFYSSKLQHYISKIRISQFDYFLDFTKNFFTQNRFPYKLTTTVYLQLCPIDRNCGFILHLPNATYFSQSHCFPILVTLFKITNVRGKATFFSI